MTVHLKISAVAASSLTVEVARLRTSMNQLNLLNLQHEALHQQLASFFFLLAYKRPSIHQHKLLCRVFFHFNFIPNTWL